METKQPIWKLVAQLGDVNPIEYGGYFIYQDETGVYPCEAEKLFSPTIYNDGSRDGQGNWTVYRFPLEPCLSVGNLLIPVSYQPDWPHSIESYDEWFTKDLSRIASYIGLETSQLRRMFCSHNPTELAQAYESLGDYHGYENLDSYSLTFNSREEVEARYATKGVKA